MAETDYSDSTRYRILDGGAVYGLLEGRIVGHLPGGKYLITKENARDMLARREEISQQQARDAVDTAAIQAGKLPEGSMGTGLGWFSIVQKAAELVLDAKSGRGAEGVLTFLGRATGHLTKEREERQVQVNHIHEMNTETFEALKKLNEALREANGLSEPVEGKVIE